MEASIRAYVSNRPGTDYREICRRFGTPEQIVNSCLTEMDCADLAKELDIRRKVVSVVTAAAVMAVMLWAGAVFSELTEHNEEMNGYITEKVVNVVRIPDNKGA